jgi:hypothetical protein
MADISQQCLPIFWYFGSYFGYKSFAMNEFSKPSQFLEVLLNAIKINQDGGKSIFACFNRFN